MNYKSAFFLYAISLITMIACDIIWLKYIANAWYLRIFGQWIQNFNLVPALCFYLLFVAGLHVFVIHMLPSSTNILVYSLYGAFLGCIAYATYDLTNLATIKDWPLYGACIDIVWGSFAAGLTTCVTVTIGKYWGAL